MGGHQASRGRTDEWLTPPALIRALGPFDLDPCSPVVRPWPTAAAHYTVVDDGLTAPWHGRVWLNPPYGPEAGRWLARLARHGTGTALVFARTETAAFFRHVWPVASAILFVRGRIAFLDVAGNPGPWTGGAPSVLVAYGPDDARKLGASGIDGFFVELPPRTRPLPLFPEVR